MDLSHPLCMLNKHKPDRQALIWNGQQYLGTCKRCGASIRREAHHHWKLDDHEPG